MNRRFAVSAAAAMAAALGACSGPAAADEDGPTIMVSLSALEFVAERVAGPDAQVTNLTPTGADPHSVELSASRIAELHEADLIVSLSGLQPSTDDAIAGVDDVPVVDTLAAAQADVAGIDGLSVDPPDGSDPHFWLDPMRLAQAGHLVADALADIGPDGASQYRERAEDLEADLHDLDAEFAEALRPCAGATLVTAHEAFGYLAARYGLDQVGIAGVDPEIEPSPARLRQVTAVVRDAEVRTIFFEVNASPEVATLLADELGVDADVLDPMERPQQADYLSVMRDNLDALTRGLVCTGSS